MRSVYAVFRYAAYFGLPTSTYYQECRSSMQSIQSKRGLVISVVATPNSARGESVGVNQSKERSPPLALACTSLSTRACTQGMRPDRTGNERA
jgi:hypothetical protein